MRDTVDVKPAAGRTAQVVQIHGTFDVANYGDLLFPHIASHRLGPLGFEIEPVSPVAALVGWQDAMPARAISEVVDPPEKPAAILIGGGNIVHAGQAGIPDYNQFGRNHAYASLWLGATMLGAVHAVPILWNAPGVPRPIADRLLSHWVMRHALDAADYVSVRDRASASHLGPRWQEGYAIVPDTAFEISAVWTKASLEPVFKAILERKGIASGRRFVAFHIKSRSLDDTAAKTARLLDQFAAAHGLLPVLLALAPCHHDETAARQLGRLMRQPVIVLDDAAGLREIAAAIAYSELFVGSSLHGYITALSYGVPAILVCRPDLPKFAGFMAIAGRSADGAADWAQAIALAPSRLGTVAMDTKAVADVRTQLDAHWNCIAASISKNRPKLQEQSRFLRSYLQFGVRSSGWSWLLDPAVI